jgi:threonyl-tRNA synthetase
VPYMLVVGDRDQEAGTASVRERRQGDLGAKPVDEVVAMLAQQRDARV